MTASIEIVVNGDQHSLAPDSSAADLVALLHLGEQRIAMEINGEIVPRSTYPERLIHPGDRIEIVRAVGGG